VSTELGSDQRPRAAIVALAGAPNAGKSTLLNRLLGRHLSIATPKPQTTRARITGILVRGQVQLVFTDTPGIHTVRPSSPVIHERMVGQARAGVHGADVTCWLVASDRGLGATDRREINALAEREAIVVLSKIDLVPRESLLPLIEQVDAIRPGTQCIPVSAKTGENVDVLVQALEREAAEGPWLYPADALTDQPSRWLAAELVREQLFEQLEREMPYRIAVKTEIYEQRGRTVYIEAVIYVDAASAKKIVIGKGGQQIKSIGSAARKRIEELLEAPVYLQLHVKVRKDWQNDARFLDELGV